jgi:DNA helicase-2/ATP-dependent DNA helicase PcrA
MHKAKGLEFEHVYCIGLVEDMIPHPKALQAEGDKQEAALEEERRLLYVGMTRAKKYLTLSAPNRYHGHKAEPSPFLYETGLLPRPKRTAISSTSAAEKRAALTAGRNSLSNTAATLPASERMKLALDKYGALPLADGDTLHHKDLGPGLVESIKPITGGGGRRVMIRFPDQEKPHDLHFELCLYLGLIQEPVQV